MKKISQKEIDYILENIDIVDLVSEYVKLEKRGKNYLGLCPFHSEKTPSFTVSPDKKIAYCFGCGNGGNIFQFLSKLEHISYNQAIIKLGERLGLNIQKDTDKKDKYNLENDTDSMYYTYELLSDYYNYILLNTKEAEIALEYLINRGITKETIKLFNIGYVPNNNLVTINFLKSQNLKLDIAKEAGIIGYNTENENYFDLFRDRIVFPIKDSKNRIVAFSGRTLSPDKKIAKYFNTPETKIFKKREVLYNLSDARHYIKQENQAIICEGYMDVIKASQNGVKNAVALMGTNIDDNKILELLNITNNIVLGLDNDDAGLESSITIGNKLKKYTDNLFKLKIYNVKDIDEFIEYKIKEQKDFNFKNYIDYNKYHFIEFKIDYFLKITKNDIEKKIKIKNEILKDISVIKDYSLKDILLSKLAENFNIEKQILSLELNQIKTKKDFSKDTSVKNSLYFNNFYKNSKYNKTICILFKYFFSSRDLFLKFFSELEKFDFEDSIFDILLNNLVIYYNSNNIFEVHKFLLNISNEELIGLVTYITTSDNIIISEDISYKVIEDYIEYLKISLKIKRNVNFIKNSLKKAISESNYEKQVEILETLKKYKK